MYMDENFKLNLDQERSNYLELKLIKEIL